MMHHGGEQHGPVKVVQGGQHPAEFSPKEQVTQAVQEGHNNTHGNGYGQPTQGGTHVSGKNHTVGHTTPPHREK